MYLSMGAGHLCDTIQTWRIGMVGTDTVGVAAGRKPGLPQRLPRKTGPSKADRYATYTITTDVSQVEIIGSKI